MQSDSSDDEAGSDSAMDGREPNRGRGGVRDSRDDEDDDAYGARDSDWDGEGWGAGDYMGEQVPGEEGEREEHEPEQQRRTRRSGRVVVSDGEELEDDDVQQRPPPPRKERVPMTIEKAVRLRQMLEDSRANPRKGGEGHKGNRSGGGHEGGRKSGAHKPPPPQKQVSRERERERRADGGRQSR